MALDIEKLASTWEPKLRDTFLKAINDIRNRANIGAIERLLANGDIDAALKVLNIDPADFSRLAIAHASVYNSGGAAAAGSIPRVPQAGGYSLQVLFNVRNLSAEAWIKKQSSKLIDEIVEDQREVVRDFLQKGLAAGQNPRAVALDLVGRISATSKTRTGGVIGLHSTQEKWLADYTRDLASPDSNALRSLLERGLRDKRFDRAVLKAIEKGTGLDAETQAKMRAAYANKALRWRAETIARTEALRALSAAQTEAYQQAIDKGTLDPSLITRFWVTAGDSRVRESHRVIPGLNPNGVKWNEPFKTPDGPSLHAPHDRSQNCRCMERVKIDFLAKVVKEFKEGQR